MRRAVPTSAAVGAIIALIPVLAAPPARPPKRKQKYFSKTHAPPKRHEPDFIVTSGDFSVRRKKKRAVQTLVRISGLPVMRRAGKKKRARGFRHVRDKRQELLVVIERKRHGGLGPDYKLRAPPRRLPAP